MRCVESERATGEVIEELVQGDLSELLVESLHWLARRQNEDGGWGDCEGAESNIAATMLGAGGVSADGHSGEVCRSHGAGG